MPPDSTYSLANISDTARLPDSLRVLVREAMQSATQKSSATPVVSYASHQGYEPFNIVVLLVGGIAIFLLLKYLRYRYLVNKIEEIYERRRADYHKILCKSNPYYNGLGTASQERFIKRTIFFMEAKDFEYVGLQETVEIPLLISATAIQLTFGLEHYMLNYFQKIYVMRENYHYGLSPTPFEGHVNENGIYLSWNNFIREYGEYTDGENVGLHEMAHALGYVNFTAGGDGVDDTFKQKFYEFSPIARPIFSRMQKGETNMLNKYAATNYEEFWAVCIESFFERPFPFREQLPTLYFALCKLLNQDPTTKEKVLDTAAVIKA